jgi:excisionase family DNA binding protein
MGSRRAASRESLTLAEAAERLGVHYMTAYRYIRTGRLPATRSGRQWQIDPADLAELHSHPTPARPNDHDRRRVDHASRLESRLLAGDEAGAWAVIETAMGSGATPERVYLDILSPVLESIGERWAQGEVDVADEHQASGVATRLVGRLGPRFTRRGRKRGTVVVGAAPHDRHGLPVAMLADLLRVRSFSVVDLGADVPPESFAATARRAERLIAVGICATTPGLDHAVGEAIEAIRGVTRAPIIVGGNGLSPPLPDSFDDVVCCTRTALDVVDELERLGSAS